MQQVNISTKQWRRSELLQENRPCVRHKTYPPEKKKPSGAAAPDRPKRLQENRPPVRVNRNTSEDHAISSGCNSFHSPERLSCLRIWGISAEIFLHYGSWRILQQNPVLHPYSTRLPVMSEHPDLIVVFQYIFYLQPKIHTKPLRIRPFPE